MSTVRDSVAALLEKDAFSNWLGVKLVDASEGRAVITMVLRDEMLNGFGTIHGGVVFAFADTAFAFSVNSGESVRVALDCTISFPSAAKSGEMLTAIAEVESTTNRLAFCSVTVCGNEGRVVAHFRGTAYGASARLNRSGTIGAPDQAIPQQDRN